LGAFLDTEGIFDKTSFHAIVEAARERGLEETCCRRIGPMLDGSMQTRTYVSYRQQSDTQSYRRMPAGEVCLLSRGTLLIGIWQL
jgi:hypothetical protein